MKNDRARIYSLEFVVILFLFLALFVPNVFKSRMAVAAFLCLFGLITRILIKRRSNYSIYQKKEFRLLVFLAILYLVIFYMFGIYAGFVQASVKFSFGNIFKYILPVGLIIVSTEFIRERFLTEKTILSQVLTFIFGVLVDLIVFANIYQLNSLNGFLLVLGYVFFASCSSNLLYNYICNRYGMKSVIVYKIITILYVYIIPVTPDLFIFFKSFFRMIYPYLVYIIVDNMFSKVRKENAILVDNKRSIVSGVLVVVMVLMVMLVSCRFLYGLLVIGSSSMSNTMDKGDAVLYREYKNKDNLAVGDIIVYQKEDIKVIHRIIDIEYINGGYRIYTKGDNNKEADEGYISDNDVLGVAKFRIRYIGLPTLYLRELFERE